MNGFDLKSFTIFRSNFSVYFKRETSSSITIKLPSAIVNPATNLRRDKNKAFHLLIKQSLLKMLSWYQ